MNGRNKKVQVQMSQEKLKKVLKKIQNQKAPGPYGVQWFSLKNSASLHKNLVWHLSACLEEEALHWIIKGTIVLIQKDKSKGNEASNSDPLHVFDMETADEIYSFLENERISPEEQK